MKNGEKGLFLEVFYKIKDVKVEITTRYTKAGNKVSRNVFCVRLEKIEPDQVGHFFGKTDRNWPKSLKIANLCF